MIMPYDFKEQVIKDLYIITPLSASDERGAMYKYYSKDVIENKGIGFVPTEIMMINSKKNVLRGIHFQTVNPQAKLVYCDKGSVYVVVVDLRKSSNTFGDSKNFILTDINRLGILIPPGCGLGSLTLADSNICICCDGQYSQEHDSGIKWNDETLNIVWPEIINTEEIIISAKDNSLQSFKEYRLNI